MNNQRLDIEALAKKIYKIRQFTLAFERLLNCLALFSFLIASSKFTRQIYIGDPKVNKISMTVFGSIPRSMGYINSSELWSFFATTLVLLLATWWGYPLFLLLPSNLTRKNARLGNIPLRVWRLPSIQLLFSLWALG
jgi:hypothetical protein